MLSVFSHFVQRAKERYDLDLTLDDLKDIAELIKSGKAKLVKADASSFRYKLRFKKKLMIVVLNRSHSTFITAIPLNQVTERSSFNRQTFHYIDALRINWLFSEFMPKGLDKHVVCPRCNSNKIEFDLAKNRFKCTQCNHIVKVPELAQPEYRFLQLGKDNKFHQILALTTKLWWHMHSNNITLQHADLTISTTIVDDDRLRYYITYKGQSKIVNFGYRSVEKIKETNYDK